MDDGDGSICERIWYQWTLQLKMCHNNNNKKMGKKVKKNWWEIIFRKKEIQV